jgi:hypothetical protein
LLRGIDRVRAAYYRPYDMAVANSTLVGMNPMELEPAFVAQNQCTATPRNREDRIMKHSQTRSAVIRWIKPLLLTVVVALVVGGCKSETSGMPAPPSGGMPPPPSGGMPAPPSPPGGESGSESSGESGSESSGESGSESSGESGGQSGSGMPPMGSGMPGGSEGPTGSSGDSGSSGEVGSFPSEDGLPPPPSQRGGGGAEGPEGADGGSEGEGEDDGDEESNSSGDCGDTGALPGGVGGMGQAGECIGGGAAAAEAESSSEAAGGAGGAEGAEGAVAGTGGAGNVGQFPVEGDAERAERLGRELEESIGGFDEILMEEQREISSVGRNTEGFGDGSAGSAGSISLGEQAAGGTISVANTGISRESPIDGMSVEDIRERTPEDIAITVDDDIIARQLREAALAEQDPELRERLWEEYRKYTQL